MFEYGAFANSQSNEVAFTDTSFAGVSAILQAAFRSSEDREEDGSGAAEPVVQLPATASVTLEQDVSARTGVAIPFQWALSCHSHLLLAQLGVVRETFPVALLLRFMHSISTHPPTSCARHISLRAIFSFLLIFFYLFSISSNTKRERHVQRRICMYPKQWFQ